MNGNRKHEVQKVMEMGGSQAHGEARDDQKPVSLENLTMAQTLSVI